MQFVTNNIQPYVIREGQSIYDLAIQFGYTLNGVGEFLKDFPQLGSVANTNIAGISILVTNRPNKLGDYLSLQNIKLATSVVSIDGEWILRTGYWDDSGIWIDSEFWID